MGDTPSELDRLYPAERHLLCLRRKGPSRAGFQTNKSAHIRGWIWVIRIVEIFNLIYLNQWSSRFDLFVTFWIILLLSYEDMHYAAPIRSALSRPRCGETICPVSLKIHSGSDDIAGTENRSIAIRNSRGHWQWRRSQYWIASSTR